MENNSKFYFYFDCQLSHSVYIQVTDPKKPNWTHLNQNICSCYKSCKSEMFNFQMPYFLALDFLMHICILWSANVSPTHNLIKSVEQYICFVLNIEKCIAISALLQNNKTSEHLFSFLVAFLL